MALEIQAKTVATDVSDELITTSYVRPVEETMATRFALIPSEGRFEAIRSMSDDDKLTLLAGLVAMMVDGTVLAGGAPVNRAGGSHQRRAHAARYQRKARLLRRTRLVRQHLRTRILSKDFIGGKHPEPMGRNDRPIRALVHLPECLDRMDVVPDRLVRVRKPRSHRRVDHAVGIRCRSPKQIDLVYRSDQRRGPLGGQDICVGSRSNKSGDGMTGFEQVPENFRSDPTVRAGDKNVHDLTAEDLVRDAIVAGIRDAPEGVSPVDMVFAAYDAFTPNLERRRGYAKPRQDVIAITPALRERELAKIAAFADAASNALRARNIPPLQADLAAQIVMTAIAHATADWLDDGSVSLVERFRLWRAALKALV